MNTRALAALVAVALAGCTGVAVERSPSAIAGFEEFSRFPPLSLLLLLNLL